MSLCSELKLQARYSTDKATKQKELGSFCKAFWLSKLEAPSVKKRRKTQITKKKQYNQRNSNYQKLSSKKATPKKKIDNTNTCYKWGKLGHYAKNCKVKKKLNEICAEYPDIRDKLIVLFDLKDTLVNQKIHHPPLIMKIILLMNSKVIQVSIHQVMNPQDYAISVSMS